MDDRTMLELAARAAGINFHHIDDAGVWWRNGHMDERVRKWNPLTDDGDALRLAAKLQMQVTIWNRAADARARGHDLIVQESAPDGIAATRRAIVRAAAAIGQRMEREG